MWKRRLLFSLVFVIGTCAAVLGWMQDGSKHKLRYLALAGHVVQVVGIIGSMLTPDREEYSEENPEQRNEEGEEGFGHVFDRSGTLDDQTEESDHWDSPRQ